MSGKKVLRVLLARALLLPTLGMLAGCKQEEVTVLKVYNWEEYIDEGGEGSYVYDLLEEEGMEPEKEDAPPIIEDFEKWYEEVYGEKVKVSYSTFIREKFETNAGLDTPESEPRWSEYAAGYMWGTTGFVYNPEHVKIEDLEPLGWQTFTDQRFRKKITAKDNVRDTYFAALGVTFEEELKAYRARFLDGSITQEEYTKAVTAIFNATDEETISKVEPRLMDIKENIYSFETDTGKADMINGTIDLNYAWSGDAVYALDEAETPDYDKNGEPIEGTELLLDYFVPEAGTNLFFDGWVMMKDVVERGTKKAAQAFVNYMSMPESAKRNSYYIGYTSVIAGANGEMLDYADWLYGGEEEIEENFYDLSYFFPARADGEPVGIYADEEQRTCRQLYAQFPPEEVISRCAVMDYYRKDASERINELWSRVKAEVLDAKKRKEKRAPRGILPRGAPFFWVTPRDLPFGSEDSG